MIRTDYFGYVDIAYWEYSLSVFDLVVLYIVFARQKNLNVGRYPEYRYLLWGLFAKVFGGVIFSLIYFYYYKGGDTISYFYSSVAMGNLARQDPMAYLTVLFGDNSLENRELFTMETGKPYSYVYQDDRTFMVIRLISPFTLLTFNSYLITTLLVSSLSYVGIWKCYRTFVRYYPELRRQLAIAVLFMPSSVFWGSAILKDTFTFSATCWYIHCVDNIFFLKQRRFSSAIYLAVAIFLIISIKPYIFMVLFPVSLVWVFYARISRIRNALVKYLFLPASLVLMMVLSFYVLSSMGDQLGKFSLDNALETVVINQQDLKRTEEYGSNYFDLGELDASWTSILSKYPMATNATLFRPYVWESRSLVILLAALENLWLLYLFLSTVWRAQIVLFFTMVIKNPLVLMCMVFALNYAFVAGVTTPNFGALVRFKIPLIPMFVSGLFIMRYLLAQRKKAKAQGRFFRFEDYRGGAAGLIAQERGRERPPRR